VLLRLQNIHVGSEVLSAVTVKNIIFCAVTPCSPIEVHRRFWRNVHHLPVRRVSETSKEHGNSLQKIHIMAMSGFFSVQISKKCGKELLPAA
jgi:hypothetical protein